VNSHQIETQKPHKNLPKSNIIIRGDLLEVHLPAVQQAQDLVLAKSL
jgi:hypothetical protein